MHPEIFMLKIKFYMQYNGHAHTHTHFTHYCNNNQLLSRFWIIDSHTMNIVRCNSFGTIHIFCWNFIFSSTRHKIIERLDNALYTSLIAIVMWIEHARNASKMKIGQKGREEVRGTAQIKNSPKNFYQNCLIQFGAFAGMVYVFIRAVIVIAWAK